MIYPKINQKSLQHRSNLPELNRHAPFFFDYAKMVRSRLRDGQADDTPIRKGSKETGRSGKKRRPVVGGSPLNSDDEEDAFGACEEDEGLEGLGVPLDSVVKVSLDHLWDLFFFAVSFWNFLE